MINLTLGVNIMGIINRIKFDGLKNRDWIVYKHYEDNLVMGTQLIVGEGQAVIFLKNGKICDLFTAGTYTLSAQNLPILQGIINMPFGGKTPFTAEIFYLNIVSKLDINWGTSDPIQLIDPKYHTKLRIRAFGQLGLKVNDYSVFLKELIGVVSPSDYVRFEKVLDYFKGVIIQKMKSIIADIIINQKISALEISAKLDDISGIAQEKISPEFAKYGLSIVNFYIKSINFPEEDFEAINTILQQHAEFEIMGDNRYSTKRTFDVYEGAANNETGVAGAFVAGGIGLGAGVALGSNVSSALNTKQDNNEDNSILQSINCPVCNTVNSSSSKYCLECGALLTPQTCSSCGAIIKHNAKFCSKCGKKVDLNE